jgi:hypothetical protein
LNRRLPSSYKKPGAPTVTAPTKTEQAFGLPVAKQRTYHVMTRIGGGWSVRKEGASRPTGTYDSKNQAIKRTREVARSTGGDVVIHNRDGLIQESTTYPP